MTGNVQGDMLSSVPKGMSRWAIRMATFGASGAGADSAKKRSARWIVEKKRGRYQNFSRFVASGFTKPKLAQSPQAPNQPEQKRLPPLRPLGGMRQRVCAHCQPGPLWLLFSP